MVKFDKELVTIQIHKSDYDILSYIAKEDDITLAHALTMQFTEIYNKLTIK